MASSLKKTVFDRLSQRPQFSTTSLALIGSLFFSIACNSHFWAIMRAQPATSASDRAVFLVAVFLMVTALQFILLSVLINRWTARPVMVLLILMTATTTYFMQKYGVFMDSAMIRNILQTDLHEARDLLAWDMLPHMILYAVIPLLFVWRLEVSKPPLSRSLHQRPLALAVALLITAGSLFAVSRQFVPLIREHKEIRYLVTPGNDIYALTRVAASRSKKISAEKIAIGMDATVAHTGAVHNKPALLIIVLGETARAANWGLNGYARQTTPELARTSTINFRHVTSCGTNTETSVPCLFSPFGKRHYDEVAIHESESLLNVIQHAGIRVVWRDNQSGCKGVCTGVVAQGAPFIRNDPLCNGNTCMDEALLSGLAGEVEKSGGDQVIVLHEMGNHGPAYFERYPPAFRRFTPTCDSSDLGQCSREQIVNTYDNALLYTDHVLAATIAFLQSESATHDTAMIYLSDHGESLGENGVYLHSMPYAIAPDEQTHVPMDMWFSEGFSRSRSLDVPCLTIRATQPASQDNLFHTVLGLLNIRTKVYDPLMDVAASCRPALVHALPAPVKARADTPRTVPAQNHRRKTTGKSIKIT